MQIQHIWISNPSHSTNTRRRWPFLTPVTGSIALLLGLSLAASVAQAQPFAYVANFFSNTVSVLATATNTVTATVGVGNRPFGVWPVHWPCV